MDFLGFWICYFPLNFTQNDTKTSFIPFVSGYMAFFAFDFWTSCRTDAIAFYMYIWAMKRWKEKGEW